MCAPTLGNDSNVHTQDDREPEPETESEEVPRESLAAIERLNLEAEVPHTQPIEEAAFQPPGHGTTVMATDLEHERNLRGHALVALDKRGYPKVTLQTGQKFGPGLEAWAPILRGMDAHELQALRLLSRGFTEMSATELTPPDERSLPADYEVTSDDERLTYTPEEVARMLGLHPNSVYAMLKRGELPGFKAGHKWLISKIRFHAWLDGERR